MASIDVAHSGRKIFGQGAVLFAGFLVSQISSFVRNAMLGHLLSRGDFGVAATIAISLQVLEIISDVAVDRMILQAKDGSKARLINTAHVVLILRGLVIGGLLWLSAPLIALFFKVPDALWAFQWMAAVPVIKGFMHLDIRRMQRHLKHQAYAIVEAFPQLVALGLVLPFLELFGGYATVVFLAIAQSFISVIVSHYLAVRPYGLAFDGGYIRRFISFGWPILLSALPLIAVYQGDRVIVGKYLGMEALAIYSAAFMLAMVPGLLTSKVCLSLVMPLLAKARSQGDLFYERFQLMGQGVVITACAYLLFFSFLGGHVLGLAFGAGYASFGPVLLVLAIMWGLRIIQAAAGTGLMSLGITRPLLIAGCIRAAVLLPILIFAKQGLSLEEIAGFGVAGEFLSFIYMCIALERASKGAGHYLFKCSMLYLGFVAGVLIVGAHACNDEPLWTLVAQFIVATGMLGGLSYYFFRPLAGQLIGLVRD